MATHNFSNLEGFVEHNENFTITEPSDRYRFTLTDPGQLTLGFLESQSAIDWTLENDSGEILETGRLTNTSSSDFSISDLVAGSYDLVFESQDASDYHFSLEPDYDAVTGLEITGGYFTVEDEDITVDYLLDGGRYEGQIGIFSLEGLEEFETGSPEWIEEVARRSASNSSLGHIVIDDRTDAARLDAVFDWESDVDNNGTYTGRQTFSMNVGDRIGIILVPNGAIQEVVANPEIGGDKRPLFSLAIANPNEMFHVGQIADAGSDVYILEDWRVDTSSDKDYNDIAFRLDGVRGEGIHKVEDLIDDSYKSWIEDIDLRTAPQIQNVSLIEDTLDSDESLELNLTAFDPEGVEDIVKFEISFADGSGNKVKTLEIPNPSFENIEEKSGDFVWNYEVSDLGLGNYTVSVRAEDASGETSDTVETSFSVDLDSDEDNGSGGENSPGDGGNDTNNSPDWKEFQVESSQIDSSGILNVEGLISDADGASDIQSVTLVLKTADGDFVKEVVVETLTTEGSDRTSFTTEINLSQLEDGNYILEAIATDKAGAESKKNQEFAIDKDEKEPPNPDDGGLNDGEPEINHPPEDLRFSILPVYTQGEDLAFDRARVVDANGIDDLNRIDFWLENSQGQRIEIVAEDVTEFTEDSRGRARFNFEYDLENLAPDRYALKAIAYDDSGAYSNLEVASFSLISDLGNGEILSDPVRLAIGESTDLDSYTAAEIEDTANWIVWLTPGTDATALAESLDATNLGESGFIPNTYIWDFDDGLSAEEITAAIENTPTVEVAYPDVPIPLRLLGRDPDYLEDEQWSLHQPIDPNDPNSHIIGVWEHPTLRNPKTGEPLSGEGVVVAIVDDGLLYDHQEFNPAKGGRYRFDLSWDYADNDNDPYPISVRSHEIPIEQTSGFAVDLTLDIPVHLTGLVKDISIQFDHSGLTDAEIDDLQNLHIKLKAPTKPLSDPGNWFGRGLFSWYYPGWNDLLSNRSDFINVGDDGSFTLQNPDEFNHSFAGGDWKLQFYTYGPPSADWQAALDKLDSFTLELTTLNPHGTAVAGILGDESGEVGTRGVAPNADIAALRLISNIDTVSGTEDVLGMAITNALYDPQRNQEIAIFNNSWGLPPFVNKPIAAAVIKLGSELRYNGLGNTYIFAAGNDRSRDIGSGLGYAQVNNYALTNSRHAIAVGAVTIKKEENDEIQIVRAPYSNPGVFVSAFSNNGAIGNADGTDIVTTGVDIDDPDLDTYLGVLSDESGFGGTSAAAPFVSGVVALMREVNPNLTNRDIQHILAETSYKVDPDHQPDKVDPDYNRIGDGWTTNGAGYDINYQYGFGAVNPKAAVELAAEWTTVDPEVRVSTHFLNVNDDLPNGGTVGLSDSVEVESDITLEWVEVVTDFAHEDWNDVTVILTSPDGTESVLRRSVPDLDTSGVELPPLAPKDPLNKGQWTFTTPRFWGESSEGEWTLQILDEKGNDISGEWNGWKLNLYGTDSDTSVNLEVLDPEAHEDGDAAVFAVTREENLDETLVVNYQIGGSANRDSDYQPLTGSVTLEAGQKAATISVVPNYDLFAEGNETVSITLTEGDDYKIGGSGSGTATIADSSTITRYGSFIYENPDTGNLYIVTERDTWHGAQAQAEALGGHLVTINDQAEQDWLLDTFGTEEWLWMGMTDDEVYSSSGEYTWVNGEPVTYTNWHPSEPNNGGINGNEDFGHFNHNPGSFPTEGKWNDLSGSSHLYGIAEIDPDELDNPIVTMMVTDAKAGENGNAGQIVIQRFDDYRQDLTLDLTVSGSATPGVDYEALPNQVTIPAGEKLITVPIHGIFDGRVESPETAIVEIQPGDYTLASQAIGQITIDDSATPFNPTVYTHPDTGNRYVLSQFDTWLGAQEHAEALGGRLVTIENEAENQWLIDTFGTIDAWIGFTDSPIYNAREGDFQWVGGEAVSYTNWLARTGEPNNVKNGVFEGEDFTHFRDNEFWSDLYISELPGWSPRQGIIEIPALHPPTPVSLEILDPEAHEDGDAAVFAVTREENLDETLVVNYQIGGSANRDSDYQPLTGSVTLEPGQKAATISVVPNYDLLAEGDETVEITLTDGIHYNLTSDIQGTATITNSSTISRYGSFIYENPDTGNLYIITERDTWYGAQAQAEALGGNLVTINDQAEQDWLIDTFGANEILWIGFTDNPVYGGSSGEFIWVNGEPVTYTNWHPSEPNNLGEEDSVHINQDSGNFPLQGKWNDRPGSHILHGIAEIDPDELDNPIVTMMVTDAKAGENGNAGQIVIQRFDDYRQDLTLDLTVSGSATPGVDYEALPNQVTIPAGEKLITVPIHGIFDGRVESPETAIVEIQPGDYTLASQAIGQITIDDSATPFRPTVYTNPNTGNRYFLSQADTWLGAQEQAEALGGRLVTIENEAENQWLINTFGELNPWIGLMDSPIYNAREGDLQWVGGEMLSYTNWRIGEPNNVKEGLFEGEDFVNFYNETVWNDLRPDPETIGWSLVPGIIEIPNDSGSLPNVNKDWQYSIDSFNDSMAGYDVGGTHYEIYATALKETSDSIYLAINSNLPLSGVSSTYASDGHVGWGDVLFNFSGNNLDTANGNGDLFGIRFAEISDSGVSELGVYRNVRATDIAQQNGMLLRNASLSGYIDWINLHGGTPNSADLSATDPYFNLSRHVPNSMVSGTKIGDVEILNDANLFGLNFGQFGTTGSNTMVLKFDRDLLPDGEYVYTLAPECDNDIVAGVGSLG
ncbi:hypothetical protein CKA32_006864 [Geitlerinema sp. FC II]|nr:hypothetical protein CKA32_006864 [Geitlerinema sp. FC II]